MDRFRNGDFIPHIESDEEWKEAGENGQPAWCYYDNDPENGKKYGKLYNWHAVNDPRGLAPEGWHVPNYEEWSSLVEFLGGKDIAGHKMKSVVGWTAWENKDGKIQSGNGDNSSEFNGLPGGFRYSHGKFNDISGSTFLWSATESNYDLDWFRTLHYNFRWVGYSHNVYGYTGVSRGASVRCLRDY